MRRLEYGRPAEVTTPHERVVADRVVLALNAWVARAFPQFERSVAIDFGDVLITEPRPDLLQEVDLISGVSAFDPWVFVHYYRDTPDSRLVPSKGGNTFAYGGHVLPMFDRPPPHLGQLRDSLWKFLPGLAEVAIEADWSGPSDRSMTGLSFFGRLDGRDNVFYGFGYSGSGVGPYHMGEQVLPSLALSLNDPWTRSSLTQGPLGRFPPEPIRYVGLLMVCNATRRKGCTEDVGRHPRHLDVRLTRFAAAVGEAGEGRAAFRAPLQPIWERPSFSFGLGFAQAKVAKSVFNSPVSLYESVPTPGSTFLHALTDDAHPALSAFH